MTRAPTIFLLVMAACSDSTPPTSTTPLDTGIPASSVATSEPTASAQPSGALSNLDALVGLTLADTASKLGIEERAFHYTDEPPAKLKVVRVDLSATESLEIHLKYDSAILFSTDREWPLSRIGAAIVLGVVHRQAGGRRVAGIIHERLSFP